MLTKRPSPKEYLINNRHVSDTIVDAIVSVCGNFYNGSVVVTIMVKKYIYTTQNEILNYSYYFILIYYITPPFMLIVNSY